jgi:heme/copper-type cytochrome/quinol oxidase subunit 2
MHIFPHRGIRLSNDHLIFFQFFLLVLLVLAFEKKHWADTQCISPTFRKKTIWKLLNVYFIFIIVIFICVFVYFSYGKIKGKRK